MSLNSSLYKKFFLNMLLTIRGIVKLWERSRRLWLLIFSAGISWWRTWFGLCNMELNRWVSRASTRLEKSGKLRGGCAPTGSSWILQRPRFFGLHSVDASIPFHQSESAPTKSCQFPLSTTSASTSTLMCQWGRTSQTLYSCLLRDPASAAERSSFSTTLRPTVNGVVSRSAAVGLYGNATLAGIPSHLIKRMQSVMNSAPRLMFSASRYDRITPLLTQLHWLKVPEPIDCHFGRYNLSFL